MIAVQRPSGDGKRPLLAGGLGVASGGEGVCTAVGLVVEVTGAGDKVDPGAEVQAAINPASRITPSIYFVIKLFLHF
jgi:hypothetical protein